MEYSLDHTPVLREVSQDWNFSGMDDADKLQHDMINFMLANRGIGLAANQIGINKRVFTMGSDTHIDFVSPRAFFNPIIVESSREQVLDTEGCLSFPGIWLKIKRPSWLVAEFYSSAGQKQSMKFEGYQAKCFQHELDHLNGVCFVDKVSRLKLQLALKNKEKSNNDRT